jgi:hypothetical protein
MAHEARWDEEGGFLDVVFEGELSAAERVSLDFAVNNIEVRRLIEASTAEELGELEPVRLRLKGGGLNMAGPAGPENVHPTIALAPDPERLRVFVGLYGGDRARSLRLPGLLPAPRLPRRRRRGPRRAPPRKRRRPGALGRRALRSGRLGGAGSVVKGEKMHNTAERRRFERWVRGVALDLLGSRELAYPEALEMLLSEDGLAPDAGGLPAFYASSDDRRAAIDDLMYPFYRRAFAPFAEGEWTPNSPPRRPVLNVVVDPDPLEDEADVAGVLPPALRDAEPPRLVFHAFRAWLKNYTARTEDELLDVYRLVLSAAVPPYDAAWGEYPLPDVGEGDAT